MGQRYRVGVRAYATTGEIGSERFGSATYGDPTDADDDFMPDSWEAVFGINDPAADDDQDGVANLAEYNAGTFPTDPDSDRDGYYDGEELERGSDPCAPGAPPSTVTSGLAVVGASEVVFHNPINLAPTDFAFLTVLNLSGGPLDWTVLASEPWIQVSQWSGSGDQPLLVQANPAGLAVGTYQGTLTIARARSARPDPLAPAAVQEAVTISVVLVVLPVKQQEIYLPFVIR